MPTRKPRPRSAPRTQPLRVNLALQGGGSHGAFTWGVLDRLLEDEGLAFGAVSGTSAGALNAAVMATGFARGGRPAAREALAAFWGDIAQTSGCFGLQAGFPATGMFGMPGMPGLAAYNLDWNPAYLWLNEFLRLFSPYQFNAFGDNPLRRVLERHVVPEALADCGFPVLVTATNVRTGQPRVFDRVDGSIDALLASACLPTLFKAVPIKAREGPTIEHYWDGGYSGNPALWPLFEHGDTLDIVLVRINPLVRPELPDTPAEIAERINEIGFNTALFGELRAIAFVQKLIERGDLSAGEYKNLRVHSIAADRAMGELKPSSKINTDAQFIARLHALGRGTATQWLTAHRRDLGVQQAEPIHAAYLAPRE
jgi:NTE family protein